MLGLRIMQTKNFQMSKLGLEKVEEPDIKLPMFLDHRERKYQHLILCPQITQNSFREHEFIPIVGELPPSSGILKKKHLLMSSTMQLELSLRSMPLIQFSSVQSLTPVSLRPHGLEHTRLLCPSLFSTVCSNSCLLSW